MSWAIQLWCSSTFWSLCVQLLKSVRSARPRSGFLKLLAVGMLQKAPSMAELWHLTPVPSSPQDRDKPPNLTQRDSQPQHYNVGEFGTALAPAKPCKGLSVQLMEKGIFQQCRGWNSKGNLGGSSHKCMTLSDLSILSTHLLHFARSVLTVITVLLLSGTLGPAPSMQRLMSNQRIKEQK